MACNACYPTLDYNQSPAGTGPISVLRSGKNVMAFNQGTLVTTYSNDYIPPMLMPGYQGHIPGVSRSCGNTYGGATQKHFRIFRQELLSRQVRPKMVYGRFPCDFTPFPDVAIAQRALCACPLSPTPNNNPAVNCNRTLELKKLYRKCQNHRDYYLDKTDRVLPDPFFYVGTPYPVRCPVDEREFKIGRPTDACHRAHFLGPPIYCGVMPCIQKNGMMSPFPIPKLPRPPFLCDREKEKGPEDREVFLMDM